MNGSKEDPCSEEGRKARLELWPGILADIAECAGDDAAAALASTVGGTEIWIPAAAAPDTQLAQLVGVAAAARIVDRFGAGRLLVPLGPTSNRAHQARHIHRLLREGWSHQRIARHLHCHVRTVERAAAGPVRDPRQLDLLDGPG